MSGGTVYCTKKDKDSGPLARSRSPVTACLLLSDAGESVGFSYASYVWHNGVSSDKARRGKGLVDEDSNYA